MKIDNCLILSAGFGTRMGAIGKKLPKVLWPIFEKSLLQLQIDYAMYLGCKNIFINTHFGNQKVMDHLKEVDYLKHVTVLHETEILGAGGAIHNVAQLPEVDYKGNLLTLNGDQFYFLEKQQFYNEIQKFEDCTNILFGLKVGAATGYGQVIIENDLMKEIVKEDQINPYYTYSGVGVTNLALLNRVGGISRFFDTVADYKSKKVKVITSLDVEYWDFGTIQRYFNSMFSLVDKLTDNNSSQFIHFLINQDAVDIQKIYESSYGTKLGKNVILLSENDESSELHDHAIIIDSKNLTKRVSSAIFYQGITEHL